MTLRQGLLLSGELVVETCAGPRDLVREPELAEIGGKVQPREKNTSVVVLGRFLGSLARRARDRGSLDPKLGPVGCTEPGDQVSPPVCVRIPRSLYLFGTFLLLC